MKRSDTAAGLARSLVIGLIAFLTLVDLFAAQAILPTLAKAFHVSPAAMGFAVNASTLGMAIAGIAVALASRRLNRRRGIWLSLVLLAVPTLLLGLTHDIAVFTGLRIVQGLFMSTAFTLTMTYLAENATAEVTASALAAYITGNVASNLLGRLVAATLADTVGLGPTFMVFAALNVVGALLVFVGLTRVAPMRAEMPGMAARMAAWRAHFANPQLVASFGIGFALLFVFIGTFTYVNFVLAAPPIGLAPMALGFVYLVFLPAVIATPFAGRAVAKWGTRRVFWGALAVAAAGLGLLVVPELEPVLVGLALVAAGTFFAQATATGFVGRAATSDRGSASGLYLASYYVGGVVGSLVLGQVFELWGWGAVVATIAVVLALASILAIRLCLPARALAHA